jgi:dihydroxyacetone kinase phosphoprotein-dependent L subunit
MSAPVAQSALARALDILVAEEAELGRIDAVAGDGDHGAGMVRGFRAGVQAAEDAGPTAGAVLVTAGSALADAAGGASGALWGVLIGTLGTSLRQIEKPLPGDVATGLRAGLEAVKTVGRAELGDKTLIDALDPFVTEFERRAQSEDFAAAWEASLPAAFAGRDATVEMVTRRGRAAALGEKSRGSVDPGAYSLCLILEAVSASLVREASGDG